MVSILQRSISLDELDPRVLNIGYSAGSGTGVRSPGARTPERFAYDYEIEFFVAPGGQMWVDGTGYAIGKGHVILRRPGQTCNSLPPYTCWYITIDPTGDSGKTLDDFSSTRYLSFQAQIRNPAFDAIPAYMKVQDESAYIDCFSAINLLARSKSETDRLALRIRLLELIRLLCADAARGPAGRAQRQSEEAVMDTLDYLHAHYAEKLTLADLSNRANLSPIYFHRLFARMTHKTPALYLQQVRLDRARDLLLHTALTCSEIAAACGFSTPSYFSMVFKRQTGMTPLSFRDSHLAGSPVKAERSP
ncbi:MAG: helix-turn-helix transcriptional regulator [Clostridiaceae bacterium]|nr:helix-turn-helix transcriptional regulator [Clostridiaceae bacterium]